MQRKQENFNKYWHNDAWVEEHVEKREDFDYSQIQSLALFTGTHPKIMLARFNKKLEV